MIDFPLSNYLLQLSHFYVTCFAVSSRTANGLSPQGDGTEFVFVLYLAFVPTLVQNSNQAPAQAVQEVSGCSIPCLRLEPNLSQACHAGGAKGSPGNPAQCIASSLSEHLLIPDLLAAIQMHCFFLSWMLKADVSLLTLAFSLHKEGRLLKPFPTLRTCTNKREWEIVLAFCGIRDYRRQCEIKPVIFYSKPYVINTVPIKCSFDIQFHFSIGLISLQ